MDSCEGPDCADQVYERPCIDIPEPWEFDYFVLCILALDLTNNDRVCLSIYIII